MRIFFLHLLHHSFVRECTASCRRDLPINDINYRRCCLRASGRRHRLLIQTATGASCLDFDVGKWHNMCYRLVESPAQLLDGVGRSHRPRFEECGTGRSATRPSVAPVTPGREAYVQPVLYSGPGWMDHPRRKNIRMLLTGRRPRQPSPSTHLRRRGMVAGNYRVVGTSRPVTRTRVTLGSSSTKPYRSPGLTG